MVDESGSLVFDVNNGFSWFVGEVLEFFVLLFIGVVIAFVVSGSWDLTGVVIVVDVLQNLVVFVWLKWLKPLGFFSRVKFK